MIKTDTEAHHVATEIGEELIKAAFCAEAEISDLDAEAGSVEDVLCLKVSVDDVVVMLKYHKKWGKSQYGFCFDISYLLLGKESDFYAFCMLHTVHTQTNSIL